MIVHVHVLPQVCLYQTSACCRPRPPCRRKERAGSYFVPSYDVSSNRRILIADAMVSDFHVSTIIDT